MFPTKCLVLALSMAIAPMVGAADVNLLEPCQKVRVSGDGQWPPYTIIAKDMNNLTSLPDLSGAGIDLAEKIFAELDLPVEEVAFENQIGMVQALRSGQIDVLVSTYWYDELANVATALQAPYTNDPVTIAIRRDNPAPVNNWEDLVGLTGLMDQTFMVDDATNAYFAEYLNYNSRGTLQDVIYELLDKKVGYVIGSLNQLKYALKSYDLGNDLVIVDKLSRGGAIHMAFSKTSPCQPYVVFASKRLQDYQNNGTVDAAINKYIQ